MEKKTFEEWEKQVGLFAHQPSKFGSKTMTREEFNTLFRNDPNSFHGVDYKERVKFLKLNGYEVTRENLFADLSARQKPE